MVRRMSFIKKVAVIAVCAAFLAGVVRIATVGWVEQPVTAPLEEFSAFALDVGDADRAAVVRVVDGDTLVVRADNGGEEKVRLIGIDAPESVSSDEEENCAEGEAASTHLKESLPAGSTVWLSRDVSDTDRYGRSLRFCWMEEPAAVEDATGFTTKCLNARLVSDGWAQAKDYPPDSTASSLLTVLGDSAIARGAGVSAKWAAA